MTDSLFDNGDEMECGAEFSPCRTWRYALWRRWKYEGYSSQVAFIGLNPSTADERQDDPTIRRCIGFAKSWEMGGLMMLNAFAYRATDPKELKAAPDPLGPNNLQALEERTKQVKFVVAAWGFHCSEEHQERICKLINQPIYCLGVTQSGRPKHPLYLKADTRLEIFWKP